MVKSAIPVISIVVSGDSWSFQVAIAEWELMRILLETARAGSFRRAETAVGLSQPAIGKKITRLEDVVGAKLLYRTKTGISLTPAGEHIYRVAEEMERLSRLATDGSAYAVSGLVGKVRIAVTDGMAGYWLPRKLRRFHRENPNVTIDIQCIDSDTEVDLSNHRADVTVMYRYPTDPDVVVLAESEMHLIPVCSQAFIEEWGIPKSLDDILNFPVVAHHAHYLRTPGMKVWAEMLDRHRMVRYRSGLSLVLGNLRRLGIGISLQPIGVIDRPDESFIPLELAGFQASLRFYLVAHREVKDIPHVRVVIRHLQEGLFEDDGMGSPARKRIAAE